jgi:predicted phosphate transport protein (TIGR00153 family)
MLIQFGVIPWRVDPDSGLQILLITSRDTGRWVIPRGNPMARLQGHETAAREAHEEAGVVGTISPSPVGRYSYEKKRGSGEVVSATVTVYSLEVTRQHHSWPERHERTSRWFEPDKAAFVVDEPELKSLILAFAANEAAFASPDRSVMPGRGIFRGAALVNLIRSIMPREDRFFDMFERHAEILVAGADAMEKMLSGEHGIPESCRRIEEHETAADDVTRDVLVAVRRSFITPFDRSAITALTSSVDDALDEMWQTAKAITLYEVKSFEPELVEMARHAAEAARLVREAMTLLRKVGRNGARLHEITEQVVHLEGKADALHEKGLKKLFLAHGAERAMDFIVGREIYSHVERVLDRLEDVADEIQGIVIDHA